jgi:outer membrane protein TolC
MIKKLFFLVSILVFGFSKEILKNNILETIHNKQEAYLYESLSAKQSIFSPIVLSAKYTKADTTLYGETSTKSLQASITQEIFRFGGVYYAYKAADSIKKIGIKSTSFELQNLRVKAYELLYKIKQSKLQIQNKLFEIENKNIYLDVIKQKYLQGLTGINELDKAIIELNNLQNSLPQLHKQKNDYLVEFRKLSNQKVDSTDGKKYDIPTKNRYLSNNISIKLKKQKTDSSYYNYKSKSFSYMPTLSIFGTYGWQDIKESDNFDGNTYNYGVQLSLPLSLNSYASSKNYKSKYLTKRLELDNDKLYYADKYDKTISNIRLLNKKIENTKEIKSKYKSIYEVTKKMSQHSLKTKEDVKILENRLQIVSNEISIYSMDKVILINSLYLN